ncbi:hypothetical protein Y045_5161 [Burkholderia pseudomallei MSHR2451]|nr:hypothetical protein Y045_5161 [Burkholderia pseudomallei MSHR2451]
MRMPETARPTGDFLRGVGPGRTMLLVPRDTPDGKSR